MACWSCWVGHEWLQVVRLDWRALGIAKVLIKPARWRGCWINTASFLYQSRNHENMALTLTVRPDAKLCYFSPQPVLYALKEQIERELDCLEEARVVG